MYTAKVLNRLLPRAHGQTAEAGFTLIELSIVVALIMLLTLAGMRYYAGYRYKAKVNQSNIMAFAWAKSMRQWKTQMNANDFKFLADLNSDDDRKKAFGYYAFSLDDSHNPWGKAASTGLYHKLTLTTEDGCGGLISGHICGKLIMEVPTSSAALEIAKQVNEKLNILDPSTKEGKTAPVASDIQDTDPVTNEPFYKELWATADGTTAQVVFYAP